MKAALRIAVALAALALFIFSLESIMASAGTVGPLMSSLRIEGILNLFGLGWLMAYVVLSGSPVAAVALGLFGAGTISEIETLGMIAGSRFGAAFVVLLLGTIHYLRGERKIITVATGVLSFLVTWTIYMPATFGAYGILASGALTGARLDAPFALTSYLDAAFDPLVSPLAEALPPLALFVLGVAVLVASFSLFDRALPEFNPQQGRFRQITDIVYRPKVMFLLGIAVTCLTLSVSVSLGILVPISAKGYVRRENVIPYVMGANISTFIDTLFAAVIVGEPRALGIVVAQMVSVTVLSLVILAFFFRSYRRSLERTLEAFTSSRRSFMVFLGIATLIPLVCLVI